MSSTFSGRKASQDTWELLQFVRLLQVRDVKRYLEIGAREGDTFHQVCSTTGITNAVAVDLPGGPWGYGSSADQLRRAGRSLYSDWDMETHVVLGDSQNARVRQAIDLLGPYDAILIDGDHTYAGVRADWEAFGHLAPLVAFHDIAGDGVIQRTTKHPVEVPRLWAELKTIYRTEEFISPGSKMGIGIVYTKEPL